MGSSLDCQSSVHNKNTTPLRDVGLFPACQALLCIHNINTTPLWVVGLSPACQVFCIQKNLFGTWVYSLPAQCCASTKEAQHLLGMWVYSLPAKRCCASTIKTQHLFGMWVYSLPARYFAFKKTSLGRGSIPCLPSVVHPQKKHNTFLGTGSISQNFTKGSHYKNQFVLQMVFVYFTKFVFCFTKKRESLHKPSCASDANLASCTPPTRTKLRCLSV
jgi:hypothetical protein